MPIKSPQFSVVITSFNKQAEIMSSIASARNQGSDVEVIVVDDCSTDGSRELLREADVDLLLEHQSNKGALEACLTGIRSARGDYIVMLDGDDQLAPNVLQTLILSDLLDPETSLRLGMQAMSAANDRLKTVTKLEKSFSLRPAHLMAVTQNTGGAALVFPRNLFDQIDGILEQGWPRISVQDHILPAMISFVARRWVKVKTIGYYYSDDPRVSHLSDKKHRLRHDRLISDHFIALMASNGGLTRPFLPRILLRLAYGLRLRKTARYLGISAPSVLRITLRIERGEACKTKILQLLND